MAFGTPLRSSTTDYINAADIASLRRELDVVINEVFSRDEGVRLGGLRSLTSVTGLSNTEQVEVVRRYVLQPKHEKKIETQAREISYIENPRSKLTASVGIT